MLHIIEIHGMQLVECMIIVSTNRCCLVGYLKVDLHMALNFIGEIGKGRI